MSEALLPIYSDPWWLCCFMVVVCLCFAFLAAGLTMGLISLEPEKIRSLLRMDEKYAKTSEEKERLKESKGHAKRVLPLIENHHRLLVTLLFTNALASEALPLFLNKIVPSWLAVLLSTSFILIFGEVVPSAIFTGPSQLAVSARFSPLVAMFQCILGCIVRPTADLLDYLLGTDDRGRYNSGELFAMLASDQLEGCVEDDTKKMLLGMMDTERRTVGELSILKPMSAVYMLPMSGCLDGETMADIIHSGCSRVPIYDEDQHNVRGIMIVKRLIHVNPTDARLIKTVALKKPLLFNKDMTLRDALNDFQVGKSHMALVVSNREKVLRAWTFNRAIPPDVHMAGIVTLESILEVVLRERIRDESDRRISQLTHVNSICEMGHIHLGIHDSDSTWNRKMVALIFKAWRTEQQLMRAVPTSSDEDDVEKRSSKKPSRCRDDENVEKWPQMRW